MQVPVEIEALHPHNDALIRSSEVEVVPQIILVTCGGCLAVDECRGWSGAAIRLPLPVKPGGLVFTPEPS